MRAYPPLPASTQLDCLGLKSLHAAADDKTRKALGLRWVEKEGMALSIAPGLPESAITMNRGFVSSEPEALRRATDAFRASGVKQFFLHVDGPVVSSETAALGLEAARGWQAFVRRATDPIEMRPNRFRIRKLGTGEARDFARIVCAAFDIGEAAEPWIRTLPDASGWHVFQSDLDGRTAGTGAFFERNRKAWTDFGATDPSFRKRGAQGAILAHRIRAAQQIGCTEVFTCTGEAVPGDPQHSYSNILRAGFSEADLRQNLAPARKTLQVA